MRAVVQRVLRASVEVGGQPVGRIDGGLCIFVGVSKNDSASDALELARKVATLRIFEDASRKMNLDVVKAKGAVLAVPQFTLLASTRRGTRPSFTDAMEPVGARNLFEVFCEGLRRVPLSVETGQFGADMRVVVDNDGPVTILLDTTA